MPDPAIGNDGNFHDNEVLMCFNAGSYEFAFEDIRYMNAFWQLANPNEHSALAHSAITWFCPIILPRELPLWKSPNLTLADANINTHYLEVEPC